LNARLPSSVRVFDASIVPDTFHARFDARRKTYRYRIWNGAIASPFERHTAWHLTAPLDVGSMSAAAATIMGRHDFAAFRVAGSAAHSSERTIFTSSVTQSAGCAGGPPGRVLSYDISGDGFLRHMVRTIAGSLVAVGLQRHPPDWRREVLASRDRGLAGPTAPPEGLCLMAVSYDAARDDSLAAEP
jgi:tRNA pseudouridine38-40 synthase